DLQNGAAVSGPHGVEGREGSVYVAVTQMSIPPQVATTSLAADWTASKSDTSSGKTRALAPRRWSSDSVASSPSLPRAISATLAPSAPKARAIARPTPLDAPVTTAILPSSLRRIPLRGCVFGRLRATARAGRHRLSRAGATSPIRVGQRDERRRSRPPPDRRCRARVLEQRVKLQPCAGTIQGA